MADIDLKTESPDASINDSAFLFGADSQSAASPSVYSVGTVRAHFVGAGTLNVASGKTLTASNTLTLAGTDGTTMTFPSTSATLARTDAGNTFTGAQTFSVGTVNGTGLNLTQTWSGTGTYTGLQYNLTNSGPANAASLMLDLQIGGVSKLSFNHRSGYLNIRDTDFGGQTGTIAGGNTGIDFVAGTTRVVTMRSGEVRVGSAGGFGFTSTTDPAGTSSCDLLLTRRAAANLRLGAADTTGTTAPTAQTLSVQSWASSTNNNQTGADFTIDGSQGTGTGAGGRIIFRVAPAGSTANGVQNALQSYITINPTRGSTASSSSVAPTLAFANDGGTGLTGIGTPYSSQLFFYCGGFIAFRILNQVAQVPSTGEFGWNSDNSFTGNNDVRLFRDAANTLAQRNGTTTQSFRVYNSFTDASNYSRLAINANQIRSEVLGSGSLAVTADAPVLDLQQTWNNSGVTFTGLKFNAAGTSDANSASGSLLLDLQLGGTPLFSFRKSGIAGFRTGIAAGANGITGYNSDANAMAFGGSGRASALGNAFNGLLLCSSYQVGFSNQAATADSFGNVDTIINRTAAGIIGVRGSNTTTGGALSFIEQTAPAAPATNGVYIYAEDDGAGKTRLMARFATGAAQQIAIEP